MGLETATYIDDLVPANPDGSTDYVSSIDDHINLIKDVLQNTFPNIAGAMTVTHTQLNTLQSTFGSKTLTSTDDKIDNYPAGTTALFIQTAAPTGWTKQTTHNNKALRVVSGTPSSGGASPFTTVFGSGKTSGSTTLVASQLPSSGLSVNIPYRNQPENNSHNNIVGGFTTAVDATPTSTNDYEISGGASQGHTHTVALDIQYLDVIIGQKA